MLRLSARFAGPLLVLAALTFASCRTADVPLDPLRGTSWRLVSLVEDGAARTELPDDQLTFNATGQGVQVSTCNSCRGLYAVGDRTLEISQLACTRRACEADRLQLDRYLSGRSQWSVTGDQLTLTVHDELNSIDAVLTFERAE